MKNGMVTVNMKWELAQRIANEIRKEIVENAVFTYRMDFVVVYETEDGTLYQVTEFPVDETRIDHIGIYTYDSDIYEYSKTHTKEETGDYLSEFIESVNYKFVTELVDYY